MDIGALLPNALNETWLDVIYKSFSSLVKYLPRLGATKVIWRTQSPRHYDHEEWDKNGTCLNASRPGYFPASNLTHGFTVPIINAFAKDIFRNYYILDVEAISRSRADAHCGTDCTHFIFPGPQHVWNIKLLDLIVKDLMT